MTVWIYVDGVNRPAVIAPARRPPTAPIAARSKERRERASFPLVNREGRSWRACNADPCRTHLLLRAARGAARDFNSIVGRFIEPSHRV